MPSSWIARWGSGDPVIALGADVDGVPTTNQTPGVLKRRELVPGAPGHGEGHNSGPAKIRSMRSGSSMLAITISAPPR
jgi:aminobenzoyl-glutamate utilization protein B